MKWIRTVVTAGFALGSAFAQTPPAHLEFEVASVKPAAPIQVGTHRVNLGMRIDGAQVHFADLSLADYVRMAYQMKNYQVVAPDWVGQERFNIDAKLPAGGSKEQVPEMLKSLLLTRFQLKLHDDSKEFPVYTLEVVPGANKLHDLSDGAIADAKAPTEVTADGGPGGVAVSMPGGASYAFGDNKFVGKKLTMPYLADTLTRFMDRPVVDRTGLKGKYDISIDLTEDDYRGMLIHAGISAGVEMPPEAMRYLASITDASLHAGLRALGLKLEQRKAPLPVIVVDSISKTPEAN